ncbi:uncharacterized protein [Notothenia coriiceps]|uniref:Myb/SANT-like DNA-binding domain-containing protein n=1 Tax=Notothenia coriiceps TaxID=8208 RepID=A0A6I9MRR9_9TELE|nr:PREDICTED: uncharacterized protein LOC104942449 [Notothenia coriiceps]
MITMALNPQFPENSYKMTEEDVKRLIELRASNEALFTGKRNSAKLAWSTILKGLGLEGKLTPDQIAKKWDNLRTKYKDLKQPYQGQDSLGGAVESWPWFHIMDEAMHGRLFNSSLVLSLDGTHSQDGTQSQTQSQTQSHNQNQNQSHNQTQTQSQSQSQSHNHNQSQENTDILEFLIKTEMEDTVAQEAAVHDGTLHGDAAPTEGVPMGWRRMSECSYKSKEMEKDPRIQIISLKREFIHIIQSDQRAFRGVSRKI